MDNGVMYNNPLIAPILSLLHEFPNGLSEHALIKRLEWPSELCAGTTQDANLVLFRQHFLVMNALYRLQDQLAGEGRRLRIDPLVIRLEPVEECGAWDEGALAADQPLRRYYLDWDNLQQTRAADVAALLRGFWEQYHAIDQQVEALRLFGLTEVEELTWGSIQRRYRQLAARHHPDKGGEPARFIEIRTAYELLKWLHGPAS
ncbi:DNA-J related domain-containing protein [Sedimenticola sp.]|uniref:DNA-J related domain-containing protein n=1 Tax=Sedimenticola sp. TaxID=1940285 RepID=UPI003D146A31